MLGIRLKNNHKFAVLIIILTILFPALYIMDRYGTYYSNIWTQKGDIQNRVLISEDFLENFIEMGFILYNTEQDREYMDIAEAKNIFKESFYFINEEYEQLYPYLDYRVEDEDGTVVDASTANAGYTLTKENINSYAVGFVVSYDGN